MSLLQGFNPLDFVFHWLKIFKACLIFFHRVDSLCDWFYYHLEKRFFTSFDFFFFMYFSSLDCRQFKRFGEDLYMLSQDFYTGGDFCQRISVTDIDDYQ